jgi:hypothetical protein
MLRGVGADCWHVSRIGTVQGCASVAGGLVGSLQTSEGDNVANSRAAVLRQMAGDKGQSAVEQAVLLATPGALNDAEAAAVVGWMVQDVRSAHYFGMRALVLEAGAVAGAARAAEVAR